MKPLSLILAFFLSAAFLGCTSPTRVSGLVPAAGTVTLNNEPLEGANITFVPTDSSRRAAGAKTDAAGKFAASTLNPADGIAPGEYKIVISKLEEKPAATPPQRTAPNTPHGLPDPNKDRILLKDGKPVPASSLANTVRTETLGKYSKADTSELQITIPPKGDKQLNFSLTLP